MVFKRTSIKRKRKVGCLSPLLDDSPKRTKVHAQRKFAQGSNVNSPVITPIKELESEIPQTDVLPEPVELLPIKRPNTEDFLTFLCFRGTPILPPSLNFFNTASIVDTNGQVHEIKSESPKNGPIDIAKCGTSSEKPFIAFGVRKRADPIVISRQMDRKRRHALALQALRRKYQEQKMAKIRALTISKLSEKVTNRTLVRTNTISKTETVTKKTNMLQKTKVIATKHVKVTTQTLKTTLRPKVKPKMCLRSFRGRFVQKELPFRKRVVPDKTIIKKPLVKKVVPKNKKDVTHEYISEDEEPLSTPVKEVKRKTTTIKIVKKPNTASASEASSSRITRSGLSNTEMNVRRQQIKKRILLSAPTTIVKPRSLRSTTIKKTVLSQRKSKSLKAKKKLRAQQRVQNLLVKKPLKLPKVEEIKNPEVKKNVTNIKKDNKPVDSKKDTVKTIDVKKETSKTIDIRKVTDIKKECNKVNEKEKKQSNRTIDVKKEVSKSTDINIKKETNKSIDIKRVSNRGIDKKEISSSKNISKEITKSTDLKKETKCHAIAVTKSSDIKKDINIHVERNRKDTIKSSQNLKKVTTKSIETKKSATNASPEKPAKKEAKANTDSEESVIVEKSKKMSKNGDNKSVQGKKEIKGSTEGEEAVIAEKSKKAIKNNDKPVQGKKEVKGSPENEENIIVEKSKKVIKNDDKPIQGKKEVKGSPESEETVIVENSKKVNKNSDKPIQGKKEVKGSTESEETVVLENSKKVNKNSDKPIQGKKEVNEGTESEETVVLEKSKKVSKNSDKPIQGKKEVNEGTESEETVVLEKPKKVSKNSDKPVQGKKEVKGSIESEETVVVEKSKKVSKNTDKPVQGTSKKEADKKDIPEVDLKKDTNTKKEVIKSNAPTTKKESLGKKDTNDISIKKDTIKNITNKFKKDTPKKEDVVIKKDDTVKKKAVEKLEEHSTPKMTQRPSRKTKEAAAIYMEILSHKLVNDSQIDDDDNISIDSFPELPNVKKTEQRENELKAQAKSTKDDTKEKSKSSDCDTDLEIKNVSVVEETNDKTSKNAKLKSVGTLQAKRSIEEKKVDKQKIKKACHENAKTDIKSNKDNIKKAPNENIKTDIICNTDSIKSIEKIRNVVLDDEITDNIPPNKVELEKECTPSKVAEKVTISVKKPLPSSSEVKKGNLGKRKPSNEANPVFDVCLEDEVKKLKIEKPESRNKGSESKIIKKDKKTDSIGKKDIKAEIASDKDVPKRQTRNSSQGNKKGDSDDSDESFHVDIKVPRRKKLTRSKAPKIIKNESANETLEENPGVVAKVITVNPETGPKAKEGLSSSDSDHSTTSDINLQTLMNKAKNKKFSKTKSMKKPETAAFSDSDEEPLSKLTNRSIEGSQKSAIPSDKLKDKSKLELKENETIKPVKSKSTNKKTSKPTEEVSTEPEITKPKRECAKRPQNYLPMLSSSDEDDIFHGFDEKVEDKVSSHLPSAEPQCTHVPPLLDLLSKDIGRRFGKEKVNMSNEQIEKWLKESALAGSSIKKENDEMLKFGERIPTETTLDGVEHIDTQKLKCSLLETTEPTKEINEETLPIEEASTSPLKSEIIDSALSAQVKPLAIDRKLIFRKNKKDAAPNINAFSPENESSVYAFGEENEEMISTPFRRPSRRPSSTATSRSEDESSKHDDSLKAGHFRKPTLKQDVSKSNKDESDPNVDTDESCHHFYIPQKPSKHNFSKLQSGNNANKGKSEYKPPLKPGKSSDRLSELEDFKYKIPSSPSASSSSSAKLYKRQTQKQKIRPPEFMSPIYLSDFPKKCDAAKLVEAPVFHPTDQEFQDPLEYIERIRHKAEQFGICRIVPPSTFKPECKVTDDMRFTAYNQYVHKMLHRWGPNFKELMAIKKYLETQNISLTHPPWIGGMEIDLPRLYQTVQTLGGLKEVIEKKKWPRVSELMKIPKSAQDRVTKLDDIYCKYLLPYDTLSPAEREKLFDEVETEWAKRESKGLMKAEQKLVTDDAGGEGDSEPDDNDIEECITKGRNMALNAFYRIARNTMSMYFKTTEPTAQEVEQEYWKHVTNRQNHICVHSGSIDSGNWGYGFAVSKNSPFARHAWNLKVLTNNSGSVLRSLGPIMGVTVPTLHVGMVFSACCWYRDPHGLPWIEYLHTGGSKIWYGIPNSTSDLFHAALKKLVPNYCRNKELWLSSDTAMVPPSLLVENKVSLCRTVQDPGQFVVVFPKVFTSSISTGYVVSESVYFAPPYWLKTARGLFDALRNSREPSIFSLDRLLLSIASDGRCNPEILRQVIPYVQELCDKEKERRVKLSTFGAMEKERMPLPEANSRKRKKLQGEEGDYECEICRMNLFISMVFDTQESVTYCLDHGIEMIEVKKSQITNCKFMFTYDDEELEGLTNKIRMAIENKLQKKVPNKYAGMPTLLTK